MSATATNREPTTTDTGGGGATAALGLVAGLAMVLVATGVGMVLAAALVALGLTETPFGRLGFWLGGVGMLGGWSQEVTTDVAGGMAWVTSAAGAPLLVTLAAMVPVAVLARRSPGPPVTGLLAAAAGAAVAAAGLVLLSGATTTTVNDAGSVTVVEGLTWLWTGGLHPGTVIGAAVLAAGTWWINTGGSAWWRAGRAVAYATLVVPGLVLTVVIAAGLTWFVSSPAVGVAAVLLFPFLGTVALTVAGGSPAHIGVTRLSPEPYDLWSWGAGVLYGAVGLLVLLLVAVVAGLVLRARRHRGGWLPGVTVTAFVAGAICWATETAIVVPDSHGGQTRIAANWIVAALVGAALAAVALAVRGRGGTDGSGRPGVRAEGP